MTATSGVRTNEARARALGAALVAALAACGGPARPAPAAPAATTPGPTTPAAATAARLAPEQRCADAATALHQVIVRGTARPDACRALAAAAGRPLDAETVDADVRALYRTGLFEDVVAVTETDGARITLAYEVRERPAIARVEVVGGPAGVRLEPPSLELADPVGIRRGEERLAARLHDAGYRRARVAATLAPAGAARTLTYVVTPGARMVLGKIAFTGLATAREIRLRKDLVSRPGAPLDEDAAERDALVVQSALFEDGLLASRVTHKVVDASEAAVDLVIEVTEGPVFRLGAVRVTGPRARAKAAYGKLLAPLKRGQIARRSALAGAVQAIQALHAGDAPVPVVVPQTSIDQDKRTIDVDFVVE